MTGGLAVVIIASEKRRTTTFPQVLESVREAAPDEIVVVADFPCEAKGVRTFYMQPMLRNTIDALVKRDIGTLVTESENICYLCEDHCIQPDFAEVFREKYADLPWSALVPSRYCYKPGSDERTWLNVGQEQGYVGGHCGIYRRHWVTSVLPWSAGPHNLNWDLYHSHALVRLGAKLAYADRDLTVNDLDLGDFPWM